MGLLRPREDFFNFVMTIFRKCGHSWPWNPWFAAAQRRLSESSPPADFYSPFVKSKNAALFVLKHSLWEPQNLVFAFWENVLGVKIAPDIIIDEQDEKIQPIFRNVTSLQYFCLIWDC